MSESLCYVGMLLHRVERVLLYVRVPSSSRIASRLVHRCTRAVAYRVALRVAVAVAGTSQPPAASAGVDVGMNLPACCAVRSGCGSDDRITDGSLRPNPKK